AETLADPTLAGDDLKASIGLFGVAAEVLSRRDAPEEAIALARRAVALAETTDALVDHADARLTLARVLRAHGRSAEADAELERARALYEAKGATIGVRRTGRRAATARPSVGAVRRRVVANAAIQSAERSLELRMREGDPDSVARLFAPGFVFAHRS